MTDTNLPLSKSDAPQHTTGGKVRWQPPSAEELQAQLPGYTIGKLIGCGGMGAVYKGVQTNLDRPVAIKILPPGVEQEDPSFAERFKSEARLMARLNHPAVVSVYDFGTTSAGQLYFAMEYVDGSDVSQMISSQGRLPPEHALAITAHVCDALAAAHQMGIVHRDIKPANVLINMQGQVKVADFGLAKVEEPGQHGLTKTGYAMGTPDFVAPEALMLGTSVDGRADLYAVGVMLYQMLTGEVPRGAFKPATARLPGLDPRFDPIIMKAMQCDREERYQSSAELRRDLDVILTVPLVQQDRPATAAIPAAEVAQVPAQRSAVQKPAYSQPPPQPRRVPLQVDAGTHAPRSEPKSKAPLMIGLSAAACAALGYVLLSDAGSPKTSPKVVGTIQQSPNPAPQPSVSTSQPSKPEPAKAPPIITAKAAEPPRPAVVTPSTAQAPAPKSEKPAGPKAVMAPPPATPSPPVSVSPSPAPSALDQRLAALESGFQAAVERDANTAFKTSIAALDKLYLTALDRALATATSGGKLEEAIALREEKQRIEKGEGVPSEVDESTQAPGKVPDTLKTLRKTYRSTTAQHEVAKAQAMQPLYDKYDQALAAVQTELTQAQKLDDALRVKAVREQIAAQRQGGAASPTAAVNGPAAASPPSAVPAGASAPPSGSTLLASKDKPFVNSLGMKFVPVPGTNVLFCIHETRKCDYEKYAAETPGVDSSWEKAGFGNPPIVPGDEHPVVMVNWEEANRFCMWLSANEGRTFRLPTDYEWSVAVGIGRDEKRNAMPEDLNSKVADEWPWGNKWPPPPAAGNYSDSARTAKEPGALVIPNYTDGHAYTAPVMSFSPNRLGIYDLGGNVQEWCGDWFNDAKIDRVVRGGAWDQVLRAATCSSHRFHPQDGISTPVTRDNRFGFRVVLETRAPAAPSATTKPATPTPPAAQPPAPATAAKSDFTNSFGMKFVKVPGTKVLFCIHETRKKDFKAFTAASPDFSATGIEIAGKEDEPVRAVSWDDAKAYCSWLSKQEGRVYRLPSDREWSYAVGLGRNEDKDEFPWGRRWPPPEGAGNLADTTYKAGNPKALVIDGYTDGYNGPAPVMSFLPNKLGIYDMAGNLSEWVEDLRSDGKPRIIRGSAATEANRTQLFSATRNSWTQDSRSHGWVGFRIVLETNE